MAQFTISGSNLGKSLQGFLDADDLNPGDEPSYQLCKTIYVSHVLGAKMAEAPIALAQSQAREIAIKDGPEEELKKAFADTWKEIQADKQIFNAKKLSRVYGISSVALMPPNGEDPGKEVDFANLWKIPELKFNVFDPLNTSGSLVLAQQPNSADFLKAPQNIRVQGVTYHRSRVCVTLNEEPVYLEWTNSAFGYVGRSVYQRPLFPLKSFVQSMRTDDLVVRKAGVIIAKIKQAGSIVSEAMRRMFGFKAGSVKAAGVGDVVLIGPEDGIETLNMHNLDGAYGIARTNILKNIATGADMPALLLENETLVSGFGEGSEDAKAIAGYADRFRIELQPLYDFFDQIVQYRAWSPAFFEIIQTKYPEIWGGKTYKEAFQSWCDNFTATWPSLITEPDSEKAKASDVKLKAMIAMFEVLSPALDPDNKATLVQWVEDNVNNDQFMFESPLALDYETLREYVPPVPEAAPGEPKPFAAQDSQSKKRVRAVA